MKKIGMALIMADMLLCLLLAAGSGFRRSQEGERAALSDAARERAQERQQEQQGQYNIGKASLHLNHSLLIRL